MAKLLGRIPAGAIPSWRVDPLALHQRAGDKADECKVGEDWNYKEG